MILNRLEENAAGIVHRTVLTTTKPGASIRIGSHVGISGAIIYCTTNIVIEDWVQIGANAKIYDTDFHPICAVDRRLHDVSQIASLPVRICEDAWIGADATILKGVTIGARSIVAAGAIVVKDVPTDCIVGGIPAMIIKTLTQTSTLSAHAES
jgi:acetyltransferase-like isoleucine patch superfamily enzyme